MHHGWCIMVYPYVLSRAFFTPGQMQVNTAQGVMSVVVPQGVMPGQSFTFQLPAVVQGVCLYPLSSPSPSSSSVP